MLQIFKAVEDGKDGSDIEEIQFLICVIMGFVNKGKALGQKRYKKIINVLAIYVKNSENNRKILLEGLFN
jgi:hypothetical protein